MAQTVSLAPTVNDATSSNIVVAAGAEVVIGLYVATGQLSDAGQFEATVTQVTPGAAVSVTKLSAATPSLVFKGPNTFAVVKPRTLVAVGVFSE